MICGMNATSSSLLPRVLLVLAIPAVMVACGAEEATPPPTAEVSRPGPSQPETHLSNITQLTFSGQNAEAYFSADGKRISFQSMDGDQQCDQIYTMNLDGSDRRLVSTGQGATTCAYIYPDNSSVLYASTHLGGVACPPRPSMAQGYVWAVYDSFDIFRANLDGSNPVRLTTTPGYDAEATIANDGRIVFTSVRDGDMEIYSMNGDGSDVKRLTNMPGPDGGAFFSADGTKIVWRGRHPAPGAELDEYQSLLKQALWRPTSVELFVMNRDGSDPRQVTQLGGAAFAPFFSPDGTKIIFASNHHVAGGREFDIFLINVDGTGLEQITFSPEFDGFPMFSPDGTKLVFASNRNGAKPMDTNVFIADWRW
jgi:Tol biopolymer transport system component